MSKYVGALIGHVIFCIRSLSNQQVVDLHVSYTSSHHLLALLTLKRESIDLGDLIVHITNLQGRVVCIKVHFYLDRIKQNRQRRTQCNG